MALPDPTQLTCAQKAQELDNFLRHLPDQNEVDAWRKTETIANSLANALRTRDDPADNHTTLGKTSLPQTLTSLLKAALDGRATPSDSRTGFVSEILRVAANLCMDHDENRGYLLEAALPQAIVLLLEGYAEKIPSGLPQQPLPLSIPHIKVVRNAVGVLLNSSVGYEPVRTRLSSLEAVVTILKLSTALYPPGAWVYATLPETNPDAILESWTLRSGLCNWSWRAISELKDASTQNFNGAILPLLVSSLISFTPPFKSPSRNSPFFRGSPLRLSLLLADFEALEESCMFLESLALDVEDCRLSLARGLHFPAEHDGVPCLSSMLSFVEKGVLPSMFKEPDFPDIQSHEKAFAICKGAMIKAIVEVSGEEKNEEVLWDEEELDKPGGEFVCKMVDWVRNFVAGKNEAEEGVTQESGRDDMVICATLSLGNLARREKHSTTLLSPPHNIAPLLTSPLLLGPASDIKVKHGVVSLLKHLAQSSTRSPDNIAALINAGVAKSLASCGIWKEYTDQMRELVQVGAIGVLKHLCSASVDSVLELVLPPSPSEVTGLQQILALGLASDSIRLKSEGTRVLVNAIKCLWAVESPSSPASAATAGISQAFEGPEEKQRRRMEAINAVSDVSCIQALTRLIGRSGRYPILVHEGSIALSLLSTRREVVSAVANTIRTPLPQEPTSGSMVSPTVTGAPQKSESTSAEAQSSQPTHSTLDMLVTVLKNIISQGVGEQTTPATNFPMEIGVNVCVLLGQIGRGGSAEDAAVIMEKTKPLLEELAKSASAQGKLGLVGSVAKKTLDAWSV